MKKSKNKKSWIEKINELDAKQQAQLTARNKTRKKAPLSILDQRLRSYSKKPTRTVLLVITIAAVILPFIAWIAGASINPNGWASDPASFGVLIYIFLVGYWFVSIPALVVIVVLLAQRKFLYATVLFLSTSFFASLYIFHTTSTASESEFTG